MSRHSELRPFFLVLAWANPRTRKNFLSDNKDHTARQQGSIHHTESERFLFGFSKIDLHSDRWCLLDENKNVA
jgi:hypothetical protein